MDRGIWAVAVTAPQAEPKAVDYCKRMGMDHFYPRLRVRLPGRRHRVEPLFPRYFFTQSTGRFRELLSTPGISGVIMNGDEPAMLPDVIVHRIRQQCDADGIYIPPKPQRFRRNQKVLVKRGALEGYVGIYEYMKPRDRASILVNMLGASVRSDVCESDLAAV